MEAPGVSRRVATGSRPAANAKVEVAVQIAERWIVARLRNQQFFSLSELNTAIRVLLDHLNDRVTRHLGASRREIFDQIERSALKPLPAEPYVFSEWKQCTVGLDYHVEVGKHYYSAPHSLLREKVWVRLTEPPRVYRRVICSTTRRPYRLCSGLHRTPPLLLRV